MKYYRLSGSNIGADRTLAMWASERSPSISTLADHSQRYIVTKPLYNVNLSERARVSLRKELLQLERQIRKEWRKELEEPGSFPEFEGYDPPIPRDFAEEFGMDPLDTSIGALPLSQEYRFRQLLEQYGVNVPAERYLSCARIGLFDAFVRKSWPKNARDIYCCFIACGPVLSPVAQELVISWAKEQVAFHEISGNISTGYKELEPLVVTGQMINSLGEQVGEFYDEIPDRIPYDFTHEDSWTFKSEIESHVYSIPYVDQVLVSEPLKDAITNKFPEVEFHTSASTR